MLPAGLVQRLERAFAVGCCLHDIPVTRLAVKQREAVMMLAGDDDVLHPGFLRQAHPGVGVVLDRVELLRDGFVVGLGKMYGG